MRWSARGEGEKRHPQHPLVRSRKLHSSPTSRATSPSASSRRRRHGVRRVDGASGGERAVRRGLPRRRGEARGASRPSLTPRAPRVVLAEKRSKRFGFIVSFLPPRPPPRLPPSHVFSSSPVRPPADRPVALPASSLLFSSLLVVVVFQGLGCSRKTARDVVQLFRRADKNADFRRVLYTGPHTTPSAW